MTIDTEWTAAQHSEFFRRSLAAWQRKAPARWDINVRLRKSVELARGKTVDHRLISGWLETMLRVQSPRRSHSSSHDKSNHDAATVAHALRRTRNWLLLTLMERDLRGLASLAEVCTAMTTFAQIASQRLLSALSAELAALHGVPCDDQGLPQDLLIVAMGKAGGNELNVSSDLDVVFVVRDDGPVLRADKAGHDDMARHDDMASSEFFHRLARQWVTLMSSVQEDGFIFRIDTRLRPEGDSGPLVVTLAMLEHYFYGQAREWERFAWIKSHVIANSMLAPAQATSSDEQALIAIVQPFVFRRYLDFGAFDSLRELHARIRTEVDRKDARSDGSYDVKLGRGGIREIEFIAQLFQIVRGGRDAALRGRATLASLQALARRKHLARADADALASAYTLLRQVEHALQYREDAQTHRLTAQPAGRAAIASMLRLPAAQFEQALQQATASAQQVFEQLLLEPGAAPAATRNHKDDSIAELAVNDISVTDISVTDISVTDTAVTDAAVTARCDALRAGSRYRSARLETQQVIDELIGRALALKTAAAGVLRLIDLIETVIGRPAYLSLLARYPRALRRVLDMLAKAQWAFEYLNRHPIVLDELLDGQLLEAVDYRAWASDAETQLAQARIGGEANVERQMDWVREAHHAQQFRLLAQDIGGVLTLERLSDHLSELADRVLDVTIRLLWSQSPLRFREQPRFAAIAYGKLGGKELGYASDLDLVFLYDDDDERAAEAYTKLAQKVSGWLSLRTGAGIVFDVDLRLRPNGSAGMLVTAVDAFADYQRESAWVWEHQALTRARFAAGDAAIGQRFEAIRNEVLALPRDEVTLAKEVKQMRRKMQEGHPNRSALFDIKHDHGGMVDIEFIVQYLVLAYGNRFANLLANAGNIALLGRAAQNGLIDAGLGIKVADAYRQYRQQQHLLRLNGAAYSRIAIDQLTQERAAVVALWQATIERSSKAT